MASQEDLISKQLGQQVLLPATPLLSKRLLRVTIILFLLSLDHLVYAQKNAQWISFGAENDILFKTDQDFTHGTNAGYYNQAWGNTFIKKLFLHSGSSQNVAGLTLVSNLFTPANISDTNIQKTDRPFTATLELGLHYISFYEKTRIESIISAGVIGECAMGKQIQTFVHEHLPHNQIPDGWENQMACNPIFAYSLRLDYALIQRPTLELFSTSTLRLGLPQTDLSSGLLWRIGNFYPYLKSMGVENKEQRLAHTLRNWQLFLQGSASMRAVAYDAVLQGGILDEDDNPYLIQASRLQRIYPFADMGVYGSYKNLGISLKASIMGKSYDTGRIDKWASLLIWFAF